MSFNDQDQDQPGQGLEKDRLWLEGRELPGQESGPLAREQESGEEAESGEKVESLEGQTGDIHDLKNGLFPGDMGVLPFPARLVLCRLLKGPYVDRALSPDLWSSLVKYQDAVESWLGEIFLELVADHQSGVGFIRQVDASLLPVKVPILLRRKQVSFLESLLLIFLRERLTLAELQGERATIKASEMAEHLRVFRKRGDSDFARLDKRIHAVIYNVANKYYFLRKVSSAAEDIYEISPTLKLILSPESVGMLKEEYQDYFSGVFDSADSEDGEGPEAAFWPDDGEDVDGEDDGDDDDA
jgi:hypothetical protein